eukprot:scaffold1995_cov167-Amphora_coffeaeformis.AAC.6
MWFCPLDGTLLKVDREESTNRSTFLCTTCPYSCPIIQTQSVKTATKRKEVDDILGGAAAVSLASWAGTDGLQYLFLSYHASPILFFLANSSGKMWIVPWRLARTVITRKLILCRFKFEVLMNRKFFCSVTRRGYQVRSYT